MIAVIGFGGIHALLTPEPDDLPAAERLYTSDEVAALLAMVIHPRPPRAPRSVLAELKEGSR